MPENTQQISARDEPDRHFADALSIVNRTDLDYLTRLEMLQRWLARLSDGEAVQGSRKEVEGAILALQSRSKLKTDMPDEQPVTTTYGGVERTNLRHYAVRRVLDRIRRVFR